MPAKKLENQSVIVADSDWFSQRLTRSILSNLEVAQLSICMDEAETLEMIRRSAMPSSPEADQHSCPDVILVDSALEPHGAMNLIRKLRSPEFGDCKDLSIFIMSETGAFSESEEARSHGVNGFLSKPLNMTSVYNKLKAIEKDQPIQSKGYVGPERRKKSENYVGLERRQQRLH
ncbi:response regulator [Kiloniella sp. b19]|uniref:response regulator n=1 Tax=Kiloniella sp. GXU_MW_B19 TaxID=3141326 RepID=UPI0031D3A01A